MITYKCPKCTYSFNQSHKEWDEAVKSSSCPKCSARLVDFVVPIKSPENEKVSPSKKLSHNSIGYGVLIIGALLAKFALIMWLGVVGYTLIIFGIVIILSL